MLDVLKNVSVYELLDKIDDNIFITNEKFELTWMNKQGKVFLKQVAPFWGIDNVEDLIGRDITTIDIGRSLTRLTTDDSFPMEAHINLFDKFTADLAIDEIRNEEGNPSGFIITWSDVTLYEDAIKEGQDLLDEIDTPIFQTVLPFAALCPIMGRMTEHRLDAMQMKILTYCVKSQVTSMILDFSSFEYSLEPFEVTGINNMIRALRLMGVNASLVGIGSKMAQSIVDKRVNFEADSYQSFQQCMYGIMEETGYKLIKDGGKKKGALS
ncbi:STAS domain-containing protein [Peribacillus sp. SCS-37]|uniref:STAS domain-containing protein n=1 Tax=Paraperibacillus esterisolvens TaxID=3115296 RepID=UPI003906AD83